MTVKLGTRQLVKLTCCYATCTYALLAFVVCVCCRQNFCPSPSESWRDNRGGHAPQSQPCNDTTNVSMSLMNYFWTVVDPREGQEARSCAAVQAGRVQGARNGLLCLFTCHAPILF